MAREAGLWRYLREGMRGRWDVQRHEDKLSSGIPDVSFGLPGITGHWTTDDEYGKEYWRAAQPAVDGWIELKRLDGWPVRAGTGLDVGLRQDQADWLAGRGANGYGACFVLVQVGRDYLLFHWKQAAAIVGKIPQDALWTLARNTWEGRIVWSDFEEELRR